MNFKFTSADCSLAATNLNNSAQKIGELLEDFSTLINSVSNNYQSDASTEITASFNKVKARGPEFQEAIISCAKYLTDTVAPAYEKLEETAKSKIEM